MDALKRIFTKRNTLCHCDYCIKYMSFTIVGGVLLPILLYFFVKRFYYGHVLVIRRKNITNRTNSSVFKGNVKYPETKSYYEFDRKSQSGQSDIEGSKIHLSNFVRIKTERNPIEPERFDFKKHNRMKQIIV